MRLKTSGDLFTNHVLLYSAKASIYLIHIFSRKIYRSPLTITAFCLYLSVFWKIWKNISGKPVASKYHKTFAVIMEPVDMKQAPRGNLMRLHHLYKRVFSKALRTDQRTDGRMDRPMDGWTDGHTLM